MHRIKYVFYINCRKNSHNNSSIYEITSYCHFLTKKNSSFQFSSPPSSQKPSCEQFLIIFSWKYLFNILQKTLIKGFFSIRKFLFKEDLRCSLKWICWVEKKRQCKVFCIITLIDSSVKSPDQSFEKNTSVITVSPLPS